MTWESMITVGRIIRPHGIKGAVVVAPESDFARDRFRPGAVVQWQRNGLAAPIRVAASREFGGRWIVELEGVATMNDAETLRGLELRIPAAALHPLEAGAYYIHDLEGCLVVTIAGEEIGRVAGVQFGSGAPLLKVGEPDGGEVLVPLTDAICRDVDLTARRIVIDPPAGLIELNRSARR